MTAATLAEVALVVWGATLILAFLVAIAFLMARGDRESRPRPLRELWAWFRERFAGRMPRTRPARPWPAGECQVPGCRRRGVAWVAVGTKPPRRRCWTHARIDG